MNSLFILSFSEPIENNFIITGQTHQHLTKVMRRNIGDHLTIAAPNGDTYLTTITELNRQHLIAAINSQIEPCGVSPLNITLFQAVIKGDKFELIIQKAVELGVKYFTPVITARTISDIPYNKLTAKVERWQKIADSACEQCERSIRMIINSPVKFKNIKFEKDTENFFLHERLGSDWPAIQSKNVSLYIGPEGGWDESEMDFIKQHKITIVNMGKRILRSETAAICALTILQYKYGDLKIEE